MRKFCNLVINEYIKIFAKLSTKILLIVIAVFSIAIFGLMRITLTSHYEHDWVETYRYTVQSLESSLETALKQDPPEPGYIANLRQDLVYYEYLLDQAKTGTVFSGWRDDAVRGAFHAADGGPIDTAIQDKLINFAKTDDWKGYAKHQIERTEDPDEAWYYQYALDKNIPLFGSLNSTEYSLLMQEMSWHRGVLLRYQNDPPANDTERDEFATAQSEFYTREYQIEHNIPLAVPNPGGAQSAPKTGDHLLWFAFVYTLPTITFLGVLIIIIAGSSIPSEFADGTIKFLLINPVKRWKILTAKFVSVATVGLGIVMLYFILNVLTGSIFNGFGDFFAPRLWYSDGAVHSVPGMLFYFGQYLLGSVSVMVMATFAFAISSLLRSSALAIGLSLFLMLAGSGIMTVLSQLGLDWGRYVIFANLDLSAISLGNVPFVGMTLSFSLIVIAVYMVVFILTAWDGFMRRDVK